jgi:hypothetical protein
LISESFNHFTDIRIYFSLKLKFTWQTAFAPGYAIAQPKIANQKPIQQNPAGYHHGHKCNDEMNALNLNLLHLKVAEIVEKLQSKTSLQPKTQINIGR